MEIYIRPLKIKDALISYKWRNNFKIWEYTGSKPDIEITPEIEMTWIKNVINREEQKRFAICISDTGEYIGNVQLININNKKAEFHIFIGETSFWGKGIGEKATKLMIDHGFEVLGLEEIYLTVNKSNNKAINLYQNLGFLCLKSKRESILMTLTNPIPKKNN